MYRVLCEVKSKAKTPKGISKAVTNDGYCLTVEEVEESFKKRDGFIVADGKKITVYYDG